MKPGNRQFIEMVPIHTKQMLWKMGEGFISDAFLPSAERLFNFSNIFSGINKPYIKQFGLV
jgi:hypothetical protein